jgi:hypothetical protein
MITHDRRWSLPRGNTPVPSRWQATIPSLRSAPRAFSPTLTLTQRVAIYRCRPPARAR